jgi:hypothetical protein
MDEPALKFVEDPYGEDQIDGMVREFQETGYVVLPDAVRRESVDPFMEQIEALMVFDGLQCAIPDHAPHHVWSAFAPRARQVLPLVLSRSSARASPSLHTTIQVIETEETRGYAPDWHKDREPEGMPGEQYHYPLDVFLAFYFEDLTEDHGPTLVIPGSHRDVSLTPFNDSPVEPIICRKQDAVLLDQRTWHRGSPRKAQGIRFLIVYGISAMPHFYSSVLQMPRSQRRAWMNAKNTKDRIYLGGPYAPPDEEALNEMLQELRRTGAPRTVFPK